MTDRRAFLWLMVVAGCSGAGPRGTSSGPGGSGGSGGAEVVGPDAGRGSRDAARLVDGGSTVADDAAGMTGASGGGTGRIPSGTLYGGEGPDRGQALARDAKGNLYLAGTTEWGEGPTAEETHFPVLDPGNGAYFQPQLRGNFDGFIVKFDEHGVRRWATLLGGSAYEELTAMAVDAAGNVFVAGLTTSPDFPIKDPGGGAYVQKRAGRDSNGFVAKFDAAGVLVWSTCYGGNGYILNDKFSGLALDREGNVFVVGHTNASDFPLLDPGGGAYFQRAPGNGLKVDHVAIVKFDNGGVRKWATLYGDTDPTDPRGSEVDAVIVDTNGDLQVTGETDARAFPLLDRGGGAYFKPPRGVAFLLTFDAGGVRKGATYLDIIGRALASDAAGNLYVVGDVTGDLPLLDPGGGAWTQAPDRQDAIILRMSPKGVRTAAIRYGGPADDRPRAVAVDASGRLYVAGLIFPYQDGLLQTNFAVFDPKDGSYFQGTGAGIVDAFVVRFGPGLDREAATLYGGTLVDYINVMLVDAAGNLTVAGTTNSSDLPVQDPGAGAYYQPRLAGPFGKDDAFVVTFRP
jgi:hypothetical protein